MATGDVTAGIKTNDGKKSLVLNGTSAYTQINYADSLNKCAEFSISFWMYNHIPFSEMGTNYPALIYRNDAAFYIFGNKGNNKLTFKYEDKNATAEYEISTDTIDARKWYHVVAIYDGTSISLYIDGILDSTPTPTEDVPSCDWTFIRFGTSTTQYYDGTIDEVMIFNAPLSEEEITFLYENRGLKLPQSYPCANCLKGYWNFADGTAKDLSGNGNDGTFEGNARTGIIEDTIRSHIETIRTGANDHFLLSKTGKNQAVIIGIEEA